jgi:pimeloyl-ACP methyl ester carboxylesterase
MSNNTIPDIGTVEAAKIDGLSIRYARAGESKHIPIILTAPWPESIYAFHRVIPRLAAKYPVISVDLPGFGLSESRPDVMAPKAMGDFLIKILNYFCINLAHIVAPDVGTAAVLFAAIKRKELFESMVIGSVAMQPELAGATLKNRIYSSAGIYTETGAESMKPYLEHAALLTPSSIIEDFRAASAGRRVEEATQFVRGYIQDYPKLIPKLSAIKTPALIIGGRNDTVVPPINEQFLAEQIPHNRMLLLDAGHRIWEEAAEEYIGAIASWLDGGYTLLKH